MKNNKLLEIKPTLGEWKQSLKKKQKEEICGFVKGFWRSGAKGKAVLP